jgi:glutathione S-transferase
LINLYFSPGACSLAVHARLIHSDLEFQKTLISVSDGFNNSQEYSLINPNKLVPSLIFNGIVITEVIAILKFIENLSPQQLIPSTGIAEAKMLEFMSWLSSHVHIQFAQMWRPQRFTNDELVKETIAIQAVPRIIKSAEAIDKRLGHSDYIVDNYLTLADFHLFPFIRWILNNFPDCRCFHNIDRYVRVLLSIPCFKESLHREGIYINLDGK